MSIVKHDPSAGRWSSTPNELIERSDLSIEARFFVVWCLAKPPNWQLRVSHIQRSLNWGEHRWLRVAAELKKAGYLAYERTRALSGQFSENLLVRPSPLLPHPGDPGAVQPGTDEPCAADHGAYVKPKEKDKKQNNNNAAAPAAVAKHTAVVVDIDSFLIESGLLEPSEAKELEMAALLTNDPQGFLDEVCGQIRKKGRNGESGIKQPTRVLKIISKLKDPSLEYATDERERREARQRAINRQAMSVTSSQVNTTGQLCPDHLLARISQITGKKYDNQSDQQSPENRSA